MNKILVQKSVFIGALALSLVAVTAFAANIITNGSFENGNVDPGVFTTIGSGNTDITGWSVDSGSVDYIGTYWQASQGNRSIDMGGNEAGQISQTIPTIAGAKYKISFDMSGNPDMRDLKTMSVSAAGSAPINYTYDTVANNNTRENMMWESHSYNFTATGSSTTITFKSEMAGPWGPALDNVSIDLISNTPVNKDACKKNGWQSLTDENGLSFKNQGQCVSWVNHQDNKGND